MSEPYLGEIRMFAGNFAPTGWALCSGQLLSISQNDALFSLLGTIYGGDGRTTFGLPDLRGRIPIHAGSGPGLSPRQLGQKGGAEQVTLTVNELPAHSHDFGATTGGANQVSPANGVPARISYRSYHTSAPANASMHADKLGKTGSSQSHSNLMPFTCIHFIIALFGIYPSRT